MLKHVEFDLIKDYLWIIQFSKKGLTKILELNYLPLLNSYKSTTVFVITQKSICHEYIL